MERKTFRTPWLYVITLICAAAWILGPLFDQFSVKAENWGGAATQSFLVDDPTPTPSPEGCMHGPLFATLTGPTIGGEMPRGFAQFRDRQHEFGDDHDNDLKVFVRSVNLPGGTILDIFVEGTMVGQITLRSNGNGQSFLDTTVPIGQGTLLEVKDGETVILSGTFFCAAGSPSPTPTPTGTPSASPTATPTPTPTPSPTVTPSASPTASPEASPTASPTVSPTVSPSTTPTVTPTGSPSPTPTPGPQLFTAVMRGDEVVPPVTTLARGFTWVRLNSDRTRIRVFSIFLRLTSPQTAASINCPALPGQNAPVVFDLGRVGGRSGFLSETFDIGPIEAAQLRAGLCYVLISSLDKPDGEIRGQLSNRFMGQDFDGDATSDISLFRPSNGTWYYVRSSDGRFTASQFGTNGDKPIAGDFDGDGKGDLAVFRDVGGSGVWYVNNSSDGSLVARQWGLGTDRPLPGDYDGDGRSDLAVFRPSDGNWYVSRSSDGAFSSIHWGQAGDVPVAGDFDGDGRSDQAVFRPATGTWYVNRSSDGTYAILQWGLPSDVPVSGDFDGDGQADIAVFRPSDGNWYINGSSTGYRAVHFGSAGDIPVPGSFDSDRATDLAVFRPSNGNWYVLRSEDNAVTAMNFGLNGDIPITNY